MNNDEKQKLIEAFEKVIREIRVLRYTSSDEDLKGFRVHLFEDEWDKLEKTVQNMKKKEDNK